MPDSSTCTNARHLLVEVATLKSDFFSSYEAYKRSRTRDNAEHLRTLKGQLDERLEELQFLVVWPAEMERMMGLKEQYKQQLTLLKRLGLHVEPALGNDEFERVVLRDINGVDRPAPTYQEVLGHFVKNLDYLKMKSGQGFKKLLLVPFGMNIASLVTLFDDYLPRIKNEKGEKPFPIDFSPVAVANDLATPLAERALTYDSSNLDQNYHLGISKMAILERQSNQRVEGAGWRIVLSQEDETSRGIRPIFENGLGKELSGRPDIVEQKLSWEELETFIHDTKQPASPYYGEVGMTPEDWIMAFITHVEQVGAPLDQLEEHRRLPCLLTGVYHPSTKQLFCAHWRPSVKSATISKVGAISLARLDAVGVRMLVPVL